MRKIIGAAFVSLDGVMQAPGGTTEDPTGGFKYSGWLPPYADEAIRKTVGELFNRSFDLLLGRRTYDIFAAFWPYAEGNERNRQQKANYCYFNSRSRPARKSALRAPAEPYCAENLRYEDSPFIALPHPGCPISANSMADLQKNSVYFPIRPEEARQIHWTMVLIHAFVSVGRIG